MTSAETMLVSNLPQDTNHENVTNRIQMEEEEEADESNSGGHVVSMNHHDNNNNNNNNHMELVPFAATVMGSELQAVGLLSPPTMTDTTIAPIPTNRCSQEPSVFAMDAVTISSMEDNSTVQSYMSSSDRSMFTFNSTLRSHQDNCHPYPYTDEAPRPPSPTPQGREFFQEPYRIKRKFTPTESSTQRPPTEEEEEEEEEEQQQHHVVSLLPPPATATLLDASMGEATVVVIPHAKTEMSIVPSSRMVKDDISGLSSMSSMVVATPLTTRPETNRLELSSSSISPRTTDRDDERIDPMPPFPLKLLPPPPPEQHHYRRVSSPTQPDHHSSLRPFPTTTIHEHMATLLHHSTSPPPPPKQPPQQQQMSSVLTPRAQLHLLYGQPPRRKVISNNHYHCWPDSNPTHIQQWTALLVCPMTGELFLAGPCPLFHVTRITLTDPIFNGPGNLHHATTTMFWFTKKSFAEHGAAARAYDCLTFRDRMANAASSSVDRVVGPIGMDPPYLEPIYRIPDLMVIPYEIRQNIIRQQAEIRRVGGLPPV